MRANGGSGESPGRGAWFAAAMALVVRRLPFGLARVIAPSLLGFAVLNGFTFSVDLACLTAFHGGLLWPVPVSVTASYLIAFGLNYTLNRMLNFRSHGPVGAQLAVYAAVVTVNYLAWILGVGTGLARLGLDYRLARVAAGACEAVYMYLAMRWLVFRDAGAATNGTSGSNARAPAQPGAQLRRSRTPAGRSPSPDRPG